VRGALELLLVLLELAPGDLDGGIGEAPDALLPGPTVAVADDLGHPLDEAQGLFVRAPQQQTAVV
jgi:hypothetical protein